MKLINNILDLSRLEAGMMKFQLEKVEMTQNQIITNEINRMLIEYFGGTYEVHSEDILPYIRFTLSEK